MISEKALKQFIDSLPNPEKDPDTDPQLVRLGEEEILYLQGLRDALYVLKGEPIRNRDMVNAIRRAVADIQ